MAIASDGADDSAAGRIALNTSASSYQLSASPRPVKKTTAGSVYTATGVVRSDTPGKNVCLTLKEVTSGGTLVLTSDACVVAGSQWAPLPLASLTAKNDGDLITFLVRRPSGAASGESFEVDALSLVAGGGGTGSPPSTPTNVSASAVSSTEIDLSWTASTDLDPDGVAGYAIYRDGGASSIGTVGGSTTSFADTSVGPGETHTYTVSASDAEGNSSPQSTPSNPATTPGGTGSPPSTPTNVSASAVSSTEIDLSWTASTDPDPDGVAGYAIYRDGGASSIGTVGGSTTSFADTSVGPGETHTYTVSASDAEGNSSPQSTPSNPATTPGGTGSPPSTPTNVSASAVSSTEIDLSWTASTDPDPDGVAGYAIYRDGGASSIGTVGGSTTSFADTSVGPGETHTYTVSASDAEGNSSPQSTPSNPATTPQPSGPLVGLWHLDELIGAIAHDSSGHGHDGAISGPIALGLPGKIGTAYSYVPKSAVTVPDAPDLRPGTANITISYWVKITTPPCCNGIDYDMFIKGSSTTRKKTGEIKLEVQENGQASCAFYGSLGGKQLQAGPDVIDGQWHQVTCQRIGTQIIENVDGATFSATKATGAITVADPIKLGSHEGGGDWYNGLLDEVTYSIG